MSVQQSEDKYPVCYDINGMHCAACSSRLERVLSRIEGVEKVNVNLATSKALVWPAFEHAGIDEAVIASTARAGFSATRSREEDSSAEWESRKEKLNRERRIRLSRLYPMILFTLPLLLVSMGHMVGLPLPAWLEPHQNPKAFILFQLFLTLPVIWLGRHFYTEGFLALFRHSPNMDTLVAVGTGAAFIYSLVESGLAFMDANPYQHAMNLYYESSAVLLTMIEFGQFLEFSAKRKAGDAIGALMSITPETALLLNDICEPVEVPIQEVKTGDRLLVKPGSRIPVDGKVAEGFSAVDLALLTGESIPVPVEPDSELVAGSINGEGSLIMTATAVGQNTRLARIIRLVRNAQGSKAPIARLADKVSFYFVPSVMAFALLASLAWLIFAQSGLAVALTIFVAVLVMACPCAMGLATPMSIMVGTARGAQMGVLVKNGAALEECGRIDVLCLDKTGTLTTGKPGLTEIIRTSQNNFSEEYILAIASSLESRSEHPLGLAIILAAKGRGCKSWPVSSVTISPGLGLSGEVETDDGTLQTAIGNFAYMKKMGAEVSEETEMRLSVLADNGQTPLLVSVCPRGSASWQVIAILGLADQLRPEAKSVIKSLRNLGIEPVMLTGDNERTAAAIAARAGLAKFHAELLPSAKAEFIDQLKRKGKLVGMVGDGLNDAPALATSNVGLAVGSGVDVSAEAGDMILVSGGMKAVLTAVLLSRATMRNIRQNLGWAFGYNILGLPIAAGFLAIFGGPFLSPMLAGLAMALSSFSVVSNALRLRWFKLKDELALRN